MSAVEELLGLEDGGELLEVARTRWDDWCSGDERLLVVGGFDQLRPWLRHADYDAIDDVLLALAELAAWTAATTTWPPGSWPSACSQGRAG